MENLPNTDPQNELEAWEHRLINTIKLDFTVTDDWETAEHIFTAVEFYRFMADRLTVPGSVSHFIELLDRIPLTPVINENNRKYYYLLNSQ
jgi:hypothetical protein